MLTEQQIDVLITDYKNGFSCDGVIDLIQQLRQQRDEARVELGRVYEMPLTVGGPSPLVTIGYLARKHAVYKYREPERFAVIAAAKNGK